MTISIGKIKQAVCIGLFKVLYNSNLKWGMLKGQKVHVMFQSVANPTTWANFFADAVGTSIQQELLANGSYCPGLEKTLIAYSKEGTAGKTWGQLETFIKREIRSSDVEF